MMLELLMDQTGLGRADLSKIIHSAPARYKVYPIPKRTGGDRQIAQPSRPLKALQRAVACEFLANLPVHDSASAYRSGKSILDNALVHRTSAFLLKLDFVNFFNSILVKDWDAYVRRNLKALSAEDRYILRQVLFFGAGKNRPAFLAIGAPSSPMVSNIMLYDFDCRIAEFCRTKSVSYSRYADDITLSGQNLAQLLEVENFITRLLAKTTSPKLDLKREKRGLYSRAGKRMVTGLVVTPDRKISLGRERKREISAMVDHIRKGTNTDDQHMLRTKGFLGFAISCEPSFVTRLRLKYGDEVIERVLKFAVTDEPQQR